MKRRWLILAALALLLAAFFLTRRASQSRPPAVADPVAANSARPSAPTHPVAQPPALPPSAESDRLSHLVATLRALPPGQRREQVAALLRELDRADPAARSDAILAFLRSGVDVELPGEFIVGPGGWLKDWTSLRVALLDYLAQRDAASAALICREILEAPPRNGANEWALALRELARGQTADRWPPVVAQRVVELLRNDAWAATPSRAYLESFDILVAGHATALLPELDRLIANGSGATRFATFLSADRLALAAPAQVLDELNRQPALFSTQPQCRAGLFARGDVRDPVQVAALETYLRRSDLSADEQQMFAAAFPLYDLAVSDNLLTPSARRSLTDMQAHDLAAVRQLLVWQKNPALARWTALWGATLARLRHQLNAAGGAGVP